MSEKDGGTGQSKRRSVFAGMRRHNVLGVIAVYVGAAVFVLEAVNTAIQTYGLPAFLQRWVGILAVLGLPVAVVSSWFVDWRPRASAEAAGGRDVSDTPRRAERTLVVMAVVLFVAGIGIGAAMRGARIGEGASGDADSTLRAQLAGMASAVMAVSKDSTASNLAASLRDEGQALMQAGEEDAANKTLDELKDLHEHVRQEYHIVILGGVWRYKNSDRNIRSYYLRVHALDPSGNEVPFLIQNIETNRYEKVKQWGEYVAKATYDAVARDKADDGVINDNLFGTKKRGFLQVDRRFPDLGRITHW